MFMNAVYLLVAVLRSKSEFKEEAENINREYKRRTGIKFTTCPNSWIAESLKVGAVLIKKSKNFYLINDFDVHLVTEFLENNVEIKEESKCGWTAEKFNLALFTSSYYVERMTSATEKHIKKSTLNDEGREKMRTKELYFVTKILFGDIIHTENQAGKISTPNDDENQNLSRIAISFKAEPFTSEMLLLTGSPENKRDMQPNKLSPEEIHHYMQKFAIQLSSSKNQLNNSGDNSVSTGSSVTAPESVSTAKK